MLTAHELAKHLLEVPDLPVRFQDEDSPYAGFVTDILTGGKFAVCDEYDEDDEEANWNTCILLDVDSNDDIVEGDCIPQR
jgi:hypothetical protein